MLACISFHSLIACFNDKRHVVLTLPPAGPNWRTLRYRFDIIKRVFFIFINYIFSSAKVYEVKDDKMLLYSGKEILYSFAE
jgi:hypothetical protein